MGAAEMPSMQLSTDMLGLGPRGGARRVARVAVLFSARIGAVVDDRPRRTAGERQAEFLPRFSAQHGESLRRTGLQGSQAAHFGVSPRLLDGPRTLGRTD